MAGGGGAIGRALRLTEPERSSAASEPGRSGRTARALRTVTAALSDDDVRVDIVYDRSELVSGALRTVFMNLLEGGALVAAPRLRHAYSKLGSGRKLQDWLRPPARRVPWRRCPRAAAPTACAAPPAPLIPVRPPFELARSSIPLPSSATSTTTSWPAATPSARRS